MLVEKFNNILVEEKDTRNFATLRTRVHNDLFEVGGWGEVGQYHQVLVICSVVLLHHRLTITHKMHRWSSKKFTEVHITNDLKMFYTKINVYLLSPFPYSVAYSKISIRKISELSHEKGIVDL